MDLNIEHYNFEDLLNLFSLPRNFSKSHLKQAYKIVYKAHPDKSGLDKEYFIFLSKSIKILQQVHDILDKTESCAYDKEYFIEEGDRKELVNQIHEKYSSPKQFHEWFNTEFEKVMGSPTERTRENGYDEWMKQAGYGHQYSNVSKEELLRKTRTDIHRSLNEQGLVVYEEPKTIEEERVQGYSSKLPYDDLKRVYTESVAPVFEEDVTQNPLYHMQSTNELQHQRDNQSCQPLSKMESEQLLREKREKEEEANIYQAYEMVKEGQQYSQKQKEFWNRIQQIAF